MPFEKNQLLVHNTWGECVALRRWNNDETICLVTATGQRHVLMNLFLKPVFGPGPNDQCICVIEEKDIDELEIRLLSAASAKSAVKESEPCNL